MNRRYLIPNSVTAANIVMGFLSILLAASGRFELAVYFLLIAIFLDMFDGLLARALGATSRFGQEMDSFSDAISFCAAPAFLAHRSFLNGLGPWAAATSVTFLLAGVLRLARFNVMSDVHTKATRTYGVPTPIGAGYVMALVLMRDRIPPEMGALIVVTTALLMVSRIQLPELSSGGLVSIALLIGVGNYLAVILRPNWYTVGWWNVWNAVILIVAKIEESRPQHSLGA